MKNLEKFDIFLVQKCWEINPPTASISLDAMEDDINT